MKSSLEMHNLPIIIKLAEWPILLNNRQPTEHSNCFSTQFLPDVKFQMIIEVTDSYKFAVVLSKTPHDAANVSIRISMDGHQIRKVDINDWTDNYTVDDIPFDPVCGMASIQFGCELAWYGFVNKLDLWCPINLYHKMKHFLNENDLADVVINVDGEEIPAHKVVLAAHSSVFLSMFKRDSSGSTKDQIDIEDINGGIMRKVIEFLYTGEVDRELDIDDSFSILSFAIKYRIIDLKNLCTLLICKKRTVENSLRILEKADLFAVHELVEDTISFMLKNKQEIVQSNDFKDLHRRKPDIFLDFIVRMSQE